MAKKKGGKKDKAKKPEESEEERLVRLEAENLAAEERARKEVEANRLALRARQLKEQQYAYINGIKIHNQWRKIMRMSKVEDLRKDIEILSQNHEREVDRKDAIIQMMDRDLEDAEGQYQMVLRQHTQVVDSLLDLQFRRMQAIEQQFLLSLKALEDEFELEKQEVIVTHTRQRKDMQDMMAAMEQEFNDAEAELRQEFESQREELKNRNSEEYNVLKIQLEGAIEELERHFEQAHQAYLQSTEQRTIAFRQFTRNDAAAARIIERRMRKLLRLQDALAHWRTKIATNSREWEDRNRSLRAEKEIMNKHYQALKSSMDRFRAQQAERLKTLSITSAACTAELKKKLEKAEQNMKLAEMCRKYETEQEKIIPFTPLEEAVPILTELGLNSTHDGEELADLGEASAAPSNPVPDKVPEQVLAIPYAPAAVSDAAVYPSAAPGLSVAGEASEAAEKEAEATCTPDMDDAAAAQPVDEPAPATDADEALVDSEGPAGEPVHAEATEDAEVLRASSYGVDEANQEVQEYDYLNRFFLRYNKVVLDKAAIDGERTRLERENAELRQLLKQYLDGISVNEDVLNNPVNPLLIVNERLQLTLEERNKARAQRASSQHQQAEQVQQMERFSDGNRLEYTVNMPTSCEAIPMQTHGL